MQKRGYPAGIGRCFGSLLTLLVLLAGCSSATQEDALREQLASLQASIDARDAGEIEALLAEDFIGNDGIDRQGVRRMAAGTFLRFRDVGIRIGPLDVEMQDDRNGVARFTAVATGGSGGLLPEQGQLYEVTTAWRIVDGDWRIYSAQWKPRL